MVRHKTTLGDRDAESPIPSAICQCALELLPLVELKKKNPSKSYVTTPKAQMHLFISSLHTITTSAVCRDTDLPS